MKSRRFRFIKLFTLAFCWASSLSIFDMISSNICAMVSELENLFILILSFSLDQNMAQKIRRIVFKTWLESKWCLDLIITACRRWGDLYSTDNTNFRVYCTERTSRTKNATPIHTAQHNFLPLILFRITFIESEIYHEKSIDSSDL